MAELEVGGRLLRFKGDWVEGSPWQRFGLYNAYVLVRPDGHVLKMRAHAGELVPGSTEDLIASLKDFDSGRGAPRAPMTMELDPTYRCASHDCGGHCFSALYRAASPNASIPAPLIREMIRDFHESGGRIVRFDGGGDPLGHPDVRSGGLVAFAAEQGLKTTILTSGDLLGRSDLSRIAGAGCYVRVSVNAATEETRKIFHGNAIPLRDVFGGIEQLAARLGTMQSDVPVGATFLVSDLNYREVLDCALMLQRAGVGHFSVRRVLGPPAIRPQLDSCAEQELENLLQAVRALHSKRFRVSVPWRPIGQPDPNPKMGEFTADTCWQSTFKTVVEPDPTNGGALVRLCGRYRGGGVGQLVSLPALVSVQGGGGWTAAWLRSFREYPVSRPALLHTCASCIDRGFIQMVDRLIRFVGDLRADFRILHLSSPDPDEPECQCPNIPLAS